MKKLVLPIILVGVAYAAFPAAAAGGAGAKCSLNADELQGETLLVKDSGDLCEMDAAARKAAIESMAAYYRSLEVKTSVIAPDGRRISGGSTYGKLVTLYRLSCSKQGITADLCESFVDTQVGGAMQKLQESCGQAPEGQRAECESMAVAMARQIIERR